MHLGWAGTSNGILFHSGRRGGFASAIAIRPAARTAAIVFSNTVEGVDDLVFHAVNPAQPTRRFPPARAEVTLPESVVDAYTCVYEFTPQVSLSVKREGRRMFGQVTGQPRFEIFAEGEGRFFVKAMRAQITFERDGSAAVTALVLHQNGAVWFLVVRDFFIQVPLNSFRRFQTCVDPPFVEGEFIPHDVGWHLLYVAEPRRAGWKHLLHC